MDTQEEFGEITTEQAQKLFDAFSDDELLGVLEMVGDQYILNAENLKLLIRQKANDLLITAGENGATEQQIRLLEVYIEQLAKGLPFAAKAAEDANKDLEKAEQDRIKAMEDAQKAQEEAYQTLLKATIDMIKQKKNAEKDALKDQLDGYKKIIDAAKEVLDQKKTERDYNQATEDQRKEITNVEEELFELQFDDSEEAAAKRLLLEEDLAEKKRNLNDTEYDRSVEVQKDALEEEYDRYEENINRKLEAIEAYLDQSGTIARDAIAMIESRSDAFYQSLLQWNRIYGSGIDADITGAWSRAFMAVANYGNAVDALNNIEEDPYSGRIQDWWKQFEGVHGWVGGGGGGTKRLTQVMHDGGFVGGMPSLQSSETYAKLMEGEYVINPAQMDNFVNRIMPKVIANTAGEGAGDVKIDMPITVNGTLDKTVLPDLEYMVNKIVYGAVRSRGGTRNANAYSI